MTLASVDDYIARIGNNYHFPANFVCAERTAATSSTVSTGQLASLQSNGMIHTTLSSLPTGVTSFNLTGAGILTSVATCYIIGRAILLATWDNATATFTDGSSMPTVTEGNTSRVTSSPIFAEISTALNGSPGNLTITYVDQDGNTAEAAAATTLTSSAAVGSVGIWPLNSSDIMARDITNITRTGGATHAGFVNFWGILPIDIFTAVLGVPDIGDYVIRNCPPMRLGTNESIMLISTSTAAKNAIGYLNFVGGD